MAMVFGDSDRLAVAPGDAGALWRGVARARRALVGRRALVAQIAF
jgi:hypothetical protein